MPIDIHASRFHSEVHSLFVAIRFGDLRQALSPGISWCFCVVIAIAACACADAGSDASSAACNASARRRRDVSSGSSSGCAQLEIAWAK